MEWDEMEWLKRRKRREKGEERKGRWRNKGEEGGEE